MGRSELAAVESHLRLIFVHLLKLYIESAGEAARHWRGEIVAFHTDAKRRYAPSMRQRIELDVLWRAACEQVILACEGHQPPIGELPAQCPFSLDDLLGDRVDSLKLVERLAQSIK